MKNVYIKPEIWVIDKYKEDNFCGFDGASTGTDYNFSKETTVEEYDEDFEDFKLWEYDENE